MTCRKYEKWISDAFDGALPEKKKRILGGHLTLCSNCRAYEERLGRIQGEASRLEKTKPSPLYWGEFSASLERKLKALVLERKTPRRLRLGWRWAWVGAPVLAALVLSLVFFPRQKPGQENDIFSYEACLNRLHQEIGDDAKLEDDFNRVILGSLTEGLDSAGLEEHSFLPEDPFFWESLSEEEMEFIEQEIKKEIKS